LPLVVGVDIGKVILCSNIENDVHLATLSVTASNT
jgi:hypothetical protein